MVKLNEDITFIYYQFITIFKFLKINAENTSQNYLTMYAENL